MSSALTQVNNAVTNIKKANNSVNTSALNFANNRPTAANNSANNAANKFGAAYKGLKNSENKLKQLRNMTTNNSPAKNALNVGIAYMKRAAEHTAKAETARALVNIGMSVNAIGRSANAINNTSK